MITGLVLHFSHRGPQAADFLPAQVALLLALRQPDDVSRWVDSDDLPAATELENCAHHAGSSRGHAWSTSSSATALAALSREQTCPRLCQPACVRDREVVNPMTVREPMSGLTWQAIRLRSMASVEGLILVAASAKYRSHNSDTVMEVTDGAPAFGWVSTLGDFCKPIGERVPAPRPA